MKCTLCGSPLAASVARCDVCGTPVGPQVTLVASPTAPPSPTRQVPPTSHSTSNQFPGSGSAQDGYGSAGRFASPATPGGVPRVAPSQPTGLPLWVKIAAAGVAAVALWGLFASGRGEPEPVAPAAAPAQVETLVEEPVEEAAPPEPTPTEDPRDVAYAALEAQVAADAALTPVRDQWVAVIDSKYEGLVDPVIQAEPFTVEQIKTMHDEYRTNPEWGSKVRLLHNGDWGERKERRFMWVTIVDLDMSSKDDVTSWCRANRPGPADDPDHFCVGFKMKTPYG